MPFFLSASFTSKRSAKSLACLDAHLELDRVGSVVENDELLVESVGNDPPTDDRQVGIHIDGAGTRHEEEAGFEVLQLVDRQGVESLVVDREYPLGQEPGVEGEQTRGVGERGLDVTAPVTDDERVSVEDLDDVRRSSRQLLLSIEE